ncbi:hemocyanin A chain-like [Oratosquilla oratoria]|uniref:hemocyanin A chain-like n=1 Tax=Oratosquilla oratoria TaxID=337810 RepID=UPI003F75CBD9
MRWFLLAAALLAAYASATDLAHKQQTINQLLYKSTEPIRSKFAELKELAKGWDPLSHKHHCNDGGHALEVLVHEVEQGNMLVKKHWFSLFNERHREEAVMLVDALLSCTDFNFFKGHAAYFRQHMNEGEYVYALYVAVTHSDVTSGVILPPLYEVTPHLFTNSEVIQRAYTAKMTHTPAKLAMEFTGSKKNPEQRVAYFGEDIGMNSHHVHWHMDFPFWWEGYRIDRKGELFFWVHHQLTARFDAERLSNHLPVVDELYWSRPIEEGFAPHTTYRYGGEFPSRPDNKAFDDVEGIVNVREMLETESRIRDAIAHGYFTSKDGKAIYINNDRGIDILGDVIESSMYSPNIPYYGALHNYAHILLGRQGDPKGKFNMPPGVMEHFETATRDPAFFRLHKYMDNIFKEHKDKLHPYTTNDLLYSNIEITDVSIDGELVTFFEDFEFNLINALDDTEQVEDVPVSTTVHRLNHKPFDYDIHFNAKYDAVATVRIFLCPKHDYNDIELSMDEYRWGCLEMDKFWVDAHYGENHLVRHAHESTVTIPDRTPFEDLIKQADEAVANDADFPHQHYRSCGHPARLLLPKGNTKGMEFFLFVAITSGDDAALSRPTIGEHGGAHGYCGVRGEIYPDKRPMGYPLDRHIPDDRLFDVGNIHVSTVKVYHKNH